MFSSPASTPINQPCKGKVLLLCRLLCVGMAFGSGLRSHYYTNTPHFVLHTEHTKKTKARDMPFVFVALLNTLEMHTVLLSLGKQRYGSIAAQHITFISWSQLGQSVSDVLVITLSAVCQKISRAVNILCRPE